MKKRLPCIFLMLLLFFVCKRINAQAPANDECAAATSINLSPFSASCSSTISANTQGATKSSPNPSCTSSLNDDDIWYSFQATTSSIVLRVFNATYNGTGQTAQVGFSFYEAACPSTTSNIICSNLITAGTGYLIINNLVPGTVYYLRFWSSSSTQYATFEFCVQEIMQPANDECVNATLITSQPVGTICDATYNATTVGATRSLPDPACSNFNDDDIWYSFTANTSAVIINFSNARQATTSSAGIANLGYALYDLACPSSPAALACNANIGNGAGTELVGGLIPGHQYYLRFYSLSTNIYVTFDFCVVDVDLPFNDDCANAIDVPVSKGFCTSPVAGNLSNATTSPGFGAPACVSNSSSEDVWFKVTVPQSGNVTVQTSPVNTQTDDLIMEAYSGDCGSLSLITCDDDGNPETTPSNLHSRITLSGRNSGEIIYLRVLGKFTNSFGPFAICAWDHSVLPPVSPGGDCIQGNTITVNTANLNRYMWVPIFDASGNIVAEINGNGNDLGDITSSVYVNTSGQVRQINNQFYLDRNISINPANNLSAHVRVYFKNNEFLALQSADPSVISINSLNVTKTTTACQPVYSGVASIIVPDAYVDYGTDHYIQFSTPSFSSFYVHSANVTLPLKFISFSAEQKNAGVQLTWKVVKDKLIKNFEIEYSYDGSIFKSMAFIDQNKFTYEDNDSWSYKYADNNHHEGDVFYRIKMNDLNGKSIYSKIIAINLLNNMDRVFSIYPNPSTGKFFIRKKMEGLNISATLVNSTGQKIKDFGVLLPKNVTEVNIDESIPGIYFLKITNNITGKVWYEKIIKR